ncbi:MAG: hypothetical protein EOP06_09310 [Proteobacteria bacterium]|nr:MAG: hypothetical protein EOP06_09310 [Pseudomonadota bacterium]
MAPGASDQTRWRTPSTISDFAIVNAGPVQEAANMQNNRRILIQRVRFDMGTSRQMYMSNNENLMVSQSEFIQRNTINHQAPYILSNAHGLVFVDSTTWFMAGGAHIERAHDAYIARNRFVRDASFQNQAEIITTHSLVLGFAYRTAVIGNTFEVANGPITNTTRNDGETILTEGGGNNRTENLGSVTSASAQTVSDSNNIQKVDAFGDGIPENYGVAIVAGAGAGQTRRVTSYANGTMTVDRAWDVIPSPGSKYATFVWGLEKSIIQGNKLSNNPRGIWLYHTAIRDLDVLDNVMTEGGGIYSRTYQNLAQKLYMPQFNVRIAGNRVSNTTGRWMSHINVVFVNTDAKAFGLTNVGFEIRDNVLQANSPNVSSQWEEYAGSEGYTNMSRLENYNGYESQTRMVGTTFQRNACTNCEVGFRIGTGAEGTNIMSSILANTQAAWQDWNTSVTAEKSKGTLYVP